jgi:hypothetical protein
VLRQQWFAGEVEPRMFVGSPNNLHSVSIFSREIDKPLDSDGKLLKIESFMQDSKKK